MSIIMLSSQKVLAVDFGIKRLGLAVSDDRGILAAPYAVRERKNLRRDIADLTQTIADLRVTKIVFGKPKGLQEGTQHHAEALEKFVSLLQVSLHEAKLNIAIAWWDERFSTAEAWRGLRDGGVSTRSGKDSVDAHAASVILQGYLDAQRSEAQREAQAKAQTENEKFPSDEDDEWLN